ncbi:MAG: autotransporter domain-containing protein [Novosphingobium sp.]|nr:autotransporter domain-containing protein [Novosphingobium sp.]
MLALLAMVLIAAPVSAQTITGATVSPSTYSGMGQTITYSVTVNSGSRVASSATVTSQVGALYNCAIADTVNTGVTFTCTGTKTTTATDVSNLQIQEQPVVRLISFGTPTIMTYGGVLTSTYVAPPAPTVTSLSPSTGPEAGGTSVAITGTNFSGATAVSFGATPAASFTINSATSITATSPAGGGSVNVRVTTPSGASATGAGSLFTYAAAAVAPAITQNPANATVTAGNNASFTAAASGTPAPTVQWQVSIDNGGTFNNVSGATSTTLSFATVAGDSGKQYRAVFTNSGGTATTTAAVLTVQSVPVITTQPVGATVPAGGVIMMSAAASGTPTPTPNWLYSGDNGATFLSVSNQPTFSLSSPSARTVLLKVEFTNAAGSVTSDTVTLTWVKLSQAIGFTSTAPAAAVVGGSTYSVTATTTSGLPVDFTADASSSSVCSVAGNTVSFIGVGTCTINADQAGDFAYNAAPQVQQAFAVGPGANTITFPALADTPFTSAPPALSATASSGLAVSYSSNSGSVCTVSGGTISFVATGTCSITAAQAGNPTYAPATSVTQTFEVTPGANTITFPALADTPFTSAPPVLGATASSGLAIAYSSNSGSVCTVSGATISFVAVGTCSITASQAGNSNYAPATSVTNAFQVTPGVNTITFAALPNRALGSGSFALTATASSGLAVAYSTSTPTICSVSGTSVNLLAVGTCTVLANQAGNANYQPAPQVSQSFQITQAVTTLGLTSSASTVFFGMPVTLTATVSGVSPTGTVRFNDGATVLGTAVLSSGTASFTTSSLAAGPRSLTATYLGDASNLPGTSPAISVTVNARPNPAQDPDTRSSVDSQFRTAERFVRTQMVNVEGRLNQLHSDGEDQDSMNLRFSQTRPQWRHGIPGGSQNLQGGTIGYGYSYSNAQPTSGGEALLAALNPNAAWLPGAPMGMAPVAMGGGNGGEGAGTHRAAGDSLERRLFRIWASGDINFGKEQPNGGVEQRFTSTGITVGMDGKFSSNLKLGAAFGFGWDNARIGTNGSENDATNGSLTFYGSWRAAPKLFIDGLVGQGYGTINTSRFSTTGAVFLDGKRRTSQTYAALIATYEGKLGGIEFAPYLRADGIWVHLSPYTETGSPFWALAFQAADENSFSGTVGARARLPLGKDSGWKLTARGEYRTRISGDYTQLLGYADLQGTQGTPYAITGQGVNDSTFIGGLGLEGNLRNLMLRLNYDLTTLAGGNISNRISGAIGWKF